MRSFLAYSVIRLGIFGVVWALLSLTGIYWLHTGIMAAVIAMLISILFLGRQRQAVAVELQERTSKRREKRLSAKTEAEIDAEEEDALISGRR